MELQLRENWDKVLSLLAERCPDEVEFVHDDAGLITHVVRIQDCQCKYMNTLPIPVPINALPNTPIGRKAHALYTLEFAQERKPRLSISNRVKIGLFLAILPILLLLFSFLANARLRKVQTMSFEHPVDAIYVLLFG